MHVGDLDRSTTAGPRRWTATVTITAHDGLHALLAGVVVSAVWQGGATATCTTDVNGMCSVTRQVQKAKSSIWLQVTGLSKSAFTYEASANHEPDADSDGTTITVPKPA